MLKISAVGFAGMVFSPRLFNSKRAANSEIVATKVETVMNDFMLLTQTVWKNGKRISVGCDQGYG